MKNSHQHLRKNNFNMTTINALTIDVEDYFHVSAFNQYIKKEDWGKYPLRADRNTYYVLDLLDEINIKGTFFLLGWLAEKMPELVKEIRHRGHEVACHGYGHDLIYTMNPSDFKNDIVRAKTFLEDVIGEKILGYRAPSFSITRASLWALDKLIESGFLYDSSIFPIYHDLYGMPDVKPFPHEIKRESGKIIEFPLSTMEVKIFNGKSIAIPISGGGYLRLLPLWLIKRGFNRVNIFVRQPAVLYFHPWELDPAQPRIKCGIKSRFRHYYNLKGTEDKLKDLFESFRFAPMRTVLGIE